MLRAGQVLQLVVVALLGLAVVMVQSAGMSIGTGGIKPVQMILNRQAIYAALAVAALVLASRLPVRKLLERRGWSNPVVWGLGVSLFLVLCTLLPIPVVRVTLNGAHRWLRLGPPSWGVTFQPSELVKWVMVLAVALWCARRATHMPSFRRGLAPPLMLVGLACALIVIEDLGTAALIGLVACILLIAGGARIWQMALMAVPAAGALVAAIASSPYRRQRLTSFIDPWKDPLGSGYQAIQSMLAIAQGGTAGKGLGNGIQKFGYLPTDTSDCLFAVICEELGLPGAGLVIGLYLVLIWVGLLIVRDCQDAFGRLVALGVILTVGLQAAINIAVVAVVVPTKGIALPLLSAGGTGWIVTGLALGLVVALDRANREEAILQAAPAPSQPDPALVG